MRPLHLPVRIAAAVIWIAAFSVATASTEVDSDVANWLKSRAEDYQSHLKPNPKHPDLLWRERPSDLPVPAFVPPTSLAPLVRAVRPAVVNINAVHAQAEAAKPAANNAAPGQSLGSGFVISSEGFVVTNAHVVERSDQIRVKLSDGRQFFAEVVGKDPSTDLALLRLLGDLGKLPSAYLGDSDKMEVGDWVMAIGNPFGLDYSVSQGIISAKERTLGLGDFDDFLQTDALINPGNSGGPLFNMKGEVIGVNSAIISQGQGIGFAVPINLVKELLPNLRSNGRLSRGWLGVNVSEEGKGALIKEVYPQSPAAKAGLQSGDRVLTVNGRPVDTYLQLLRSVALLAPGAEVKLGVERRGHALQLRVTLAHSPADEKPTHSEQAEASPLGLLVRDLTPDFASQVGAKPYDGVWVLGVIPGSASERAALKPGDLILEVNKHRVPDVGTFRAALAQAPQDRPVLLQLQRGEQTRYIAVGP